MCDDIEFYICLCNLKPSTIEIILIENQILSELR